MPELELLVALADLDRAQFAGPVVDVLEEMAVDRERVIEIEVAAGDAAPASQHNECALLLAKKIRIGNAEPVSKNGCVWIDVRVVAHFATKAGLRARM